MPGLACDAFIASLPSLANRKFPVTDWIRKPEEFNYIVEPDVFHDLFGHVPMLFDPTFADYVQRYGQGGMKAHGLERERNWRGSIGTPWSSGSFANRTACVLTARAS